MRFSVLALVAMVTVTTAPARASETHHRPWDPLHVRESSRHLAQRQTDIGPDAAAAKVRRATGGRVLSVRRNERAVYRVKVLLPGGRVRVVSVDGGTGRLLD